MKTFWLPHEKAFLQLSYPEYGYSPIALMLNRTISSVKGQAQSMNIKFYSMGGIKLGEQYGKLIAIRYDGMQKRGSFLEFDCACGKTKTMMAADVKNGLTKSCKRCKSEEFVSGEYFASIRLRARNANLSFNLSIKFINDLLTAQNYQCAYTGLPIVVGRFRNERKINHTASLDRKDSSIGYEESNVQWVHKDINLMKSNFSENYFLQLCGMVNNRCHTK
jgi:hypothetical protein